MASIGVSVTKGSIGPGATPTIGYSNLFAVIQSPWGETNRWRMVTSFAEFASLYGGLSKLTTLAADGSTSTWGFETADTVKQGFYAVKGYFDNKGNNPNGVAFICRVAQSSSPPTAALHVFPDATVNNTTITAKWLGDPGEDNEVKVTTPSPIKGTGWTQIDVRHVQSGIQEQAQIATAADASSFNLNSKLVTIALPSGGQLPVTVATWTKLGNGTPATADAYGASDANLVGTTTSAGLKSGLDVFADFRLGTGMVVIPGSVSSTVITGLKTHAEAYDRMYFIGTIAGKDKSNVAAQISSSSNNGAFYAPRIWVSDLGAGSDANTQVLVDPVGHIAGLQARMDAEYKGPHKSAAGTLHPLSGVLDIERQSNGMEIYDDSASNTLADSFVNTIRIKNNSQVVWGNRTMAVDRRYLQTNASRTVSVVSLTLKLIGEPFTFEPITPVVMAKLQGEASVFLEQLRKVGALFGDAPSRQAGANDAYYAICSLANNTPDTLSANELHLDVAMAPTPNAESVKIGLQVAAPGYVRTVQ